MAKILSLDCETCIKNNGSCCKYCFNEKEINIFSSLSASELDFLIDGKRQIMYNPGEIIINQNESSTYAICIKEGLAKFYVEGDMGKKSIIKIISRHSFVTGGGLFHEQVHAFGISALTPVTCCVIDSKRLEKLFFQNNQFAVAMLLNHAKQSNFLLNKIINLTQKYMPGRAADTLLYLKNEIFESSSFNVPLTRQEMAEMSNMTKESFVRSIQEFKNSNLIEVKGNKFKIINEDKLTTISTKG